MSKTFLKEDTFDEDEDDEIECPCAHLIGKECICDEYCDSKCLDSNETDKDTPDW